MLSLLIKKRIALRTILLLISISAGVHSARAQVIFETYTVLSGDSIESIATRYNTTIEQIRQRNGMGLADNVYAGQSLLVPVRNDASQNTATSSPQPRARARLAQRGSAHQSFQHSSSGQRVVGKLGTIVTRGARIRSSRSARARVYFAPPRGMQLVITQQVGSWYGVLMSNGATGWLPQKYARIAQVELVANRPIYAMNSSIGSSSSSPADGASTVQAAYRFMGAPYHYGGNTERGIDCSALVKRAYLASRGVSLPRTAAQQAMVGQEVSAQQLQPGDRIYFSRSGWRIDHCGIYVGNGQFIHASGASGRVTINSLYEKKYWNWFRVARR